MFYNINCESLYYEESTFGEIFGEILFGNYKEIA